MKSTPPKPFITVAMFMYGGAMMLCGVVAYMMAPPGANAATAVAVPAVCAVLMDVCAIMSAGLKKNRKVGMIGIHAGLVLPLVFAVAFGLRGASVAQGVSDYRAASDRYLSAVRSGDIANDTPVVREAFMSQQVVDGRKAPVQDKSYLRNALYAMTGLSVVAFLVFLAFRPKPDRRGVFDEPEVQADPES